MSAIPVIAIFDVGKTNKKLFLFNEQYELVFEKTARFTETVDEDGFPCENLTNLRLSVFDSLRAVFSMKEYCIKAINFTTYGASLVYLDKDGNPLTPLYNYLKPFPETLSAAFYEQYGNAQDIAIETASPTLGSLNSGMQFFRLKHMQPHVFKQTKHVLHLPQYMSFLITGECFTDITSIGCHTQLWDFGKNDYHKWVKKERLHTRFGAVRAATDVLPAAFPGNGYAVGIGLHDSSAALIPYLVNFHEPFVLLSTGTWCISFNPFNDEPLTATELEQDCLCYYSFKGQPTKASRYFGGFEHEQQVKRIAQHFNQPVPRYRTMKYDPKIVSRLKGKFELLDNGPLNSKESGFESRNLNAFDTDVEAYHQLMIDMVAYQQKSTSLILADSNVKRIFVDGGFSKNLIYMNLLASAFPQMEVFAASMAQASALGAALAIHDAWNTQPVKNDIIELKYYNVARMSTIA